jgi:hypothetical protein
MTDEVRSISRAKLWVAFLFLCLLVLLCGLAGIGTAHPAKPLTVLPEDFTFLVRLLIVLVGCGLSWWAGKLMYTFLLKAWVPVEEATGGGVCFVFFLALFCLLVVSSGELHWGVAILLVVLLIAFCLPVLWRLVDIKMMVLMFILGLAAFIAGHFLA